jgi:hypothetical protein
MGSIPGGDEYFPSEHPKNFMHFEFFKNTLALAIFSSLQLVNNSNL